MRGKVIWLTGLPCSGKTTLAKELKGREEFKNAVHLDGDTIRGTPISNDVGFSPADRAKHIMRIGYISRIIAGAGVDVICSFVSPSAEIRERVRSMNPTFLEIWVKASGEACRDRDVKGMWARADKGEIQDFTGVGAPYDPPAFPEAVCDTDKESIEESIDIILKALNLRFARALYIGRWQPFHDGHKFIISQSLDKGIPVLVAIRDMLHDEGNPYPTDEIKAMIEDHYQGEDVKAVIIPDIRSVNIGRKVGYEIIEIEAPPQIKEISATKIREETKRDCKRS